MNKKDLAVKIARQMRMTQSEAQKIINALVQEIKDGLEADEEVVFYGFGTFSLKNRKARKARDVIAGKTMTIPARTIVAFKPAKKFADRISRNCEDRGRAY